MASGNSKRETLGTVYVSAGLSQRKTRPYNPRVGGTSIEKRGFVMPAKAGIHLRARCKAKQNLDSVLRRNNDPEEATYSRQI